MDVKVVVFDCDGVLFDSRGANVGYYNHILDRLGRPPMSPAQEDFVHAASARGSLEHLFPDDRELRAALALEPAVDYRPFVRQMVPEPGMKRVLAALKERYRTALFTNRTRTVGLVLDHFGLADLFHLVVSASQVRAKPAPDGLRHILDRFGVTGRDTIYVGDTVLDEQSAAAAGVRLVSYKNPALRAERVAPDFYTLGRWLGVTFE